MHVRINSLLTTLAIACLFGSAALFWKGLSSAKTEGQITNLPIYADPSVRDLGDVDQFDIVSAEFRIFNPSDEVAHVDDLLAGCGCAEVAMPVRTIKPGESSLVKMAWNIGARRGPSHETIRIVYHFGEFASVSDSISVTVEGNVKSEFDFKPATVEFVGGGPYHAVVRLISNDVIGKVRIVSVLPNQGALSGTIKKNGTEIHVHLDATSDDAFSETDLKLAVLTTSLRCPWIDIPVRVLKPVQRSDP